ncbi:MAG: hypothetical protein WA962_04650 [Ornithinimicrobium sp.]
MIAAIVLIVLSAATLYGLGLLRQTPAERASAALVPNVVGGVKTLAQTGAGMRPVEHLRN